ncbi:hypothetical protein AAVH_28030 [Aphelenchoides avenae]|nr:hypothetical protein AAVH_28030 [Aphelenchus avenae]
MTRHTQPVQAQLSPGNYIFSDDIAQPSVTAAVNGDGSPSTQSSSFDMLTELSSGGGALQSAVNGAAATRVNSSTVPSSIFASAVASGGAADLLRPPAVRVGGSSNVPTSQIFGLDDSDEYDNNDPLPPPSPHVTLPNGSSTHAATFRPIEPAVAPQQQHASPYAASRAARVQEETSAANAAAPTTIRRVQTEGVEPSVLFSGRLFNASAGASNAAATAQKPKKKKTENPYMDPLNAINPDPEGYRSFTAGPQQHKEEQRMRVPAGDILHPPDPANGRPEYTGNWQALGEELLCTLNSGVKTWKTAVEIAINLDEDTGLPASSLYKLFKKPDFERLLQAEELERYVRWRHHEGKSEYAAKSTPRIAHICAEVSKAERFSAEKMQKHDERKYAKACEASFQAKILDAKQKIAEVLESMSVQRGAPVAYKMLQDAYFNKHGIPLDSKEIKNLFGTPHAQKAFCIYCLDEFEVQNGESGAWHITMKMTLKEMKEFHDDQANLRLNNSRRLGENFMRNRKEYKGERAENRERRVEEQVAHELGDQATPSTSAQAANAARVQSFFSDQSTGENRRESESQHTSSSPPESDMDRQRAAQARENKEKEKKPIMKTGYTSRPKDGDYTSTDDSSDDEADETGFDARRPPQPQCAAPSLLGTRFKRSDSAAEWPLLVQANGVKHRMSTAATRRIRRDTDSSDSDGAEEQPAVGINAPRTAVRKEETTEGFGSRRRAEAFGGVQTSNGFRYDSPAIVEQRRATEVQPQVQQPPRTVDTDTGTAGEVNGTVGHGGSYLQLSVQRSGKTPAPVVSGQSLPITSRPSAFATHSSAQSPQKLASTAKAPAAPSGRAAEVQAPPRPSASLDYDAPQADHFLSAAPHSGSSRTAEFAGRSAAQQIPNDIPTATSRPANDSRDSIFSRSRSPPVTVRDGIRYGSETQQNGHHTSANRTELQPETYGNGYNTAENARSNAAPQRTQDSNARTGATDRAPTRAYDAPARSVPSQLRSEAAVDDRDEAKRNVIRNMAECQYPDVISLVRIEESLGHLNMLPYSPLVDFMRTVPNVILFEHGGYWYCKGLSSPSGHR